MLKDNSDYQLQCTLILFKIWSIFLSWKCQCKSTGWNNFRDLCHLVLRSSFRISLPGKPGRQRKTKFSRYWNSCETDKLYKDYKHIELWGSSRISGQCVTWVKPKTFLYRQNVWAPTIFRSLDTGYYLWKKLCLVPVSRLSRSFWSMHFGDESETNSLRHVTRNASAARNSKA